MRSFSKKLAFVLAAAMVVTSFAPAAKAEAAKEMAINKSSQILYVNEGINHKGADGVAAGKGNVSVYDFSVKNKPADWKDTLSFKWTTSDDEIVTVKAGGVATAVGVGKATITCKVTDKATKETVATLKTKVTVKANAADVEITNADDADGLAFAVDSTIDLNRAMYDEDGNKTTKRGKLVTDYTRWVAVPDTGVTIDNATGKFTFAEPGEYELYCETYQSSKYTKTTAKSDSVFVTITKDLELKQTSLKKFDIYFGTETELSTADLSINEVVVGPSDEYRIPVLVKDVTMSADKKTATVEVFYAMKDTVNYEVTVKGYDMVTLVASAGKPVIVNVWAEDAYYKPIVAGQVTVGQKTTLKYTLIDANGVDVTEGTKAEQNKIVFDLKYTGKSGGTYDMSYYAGYATFEFIEVGDFAAVTAKYATGEYENNVEKTVVSDVTNFYAVAKQNITVKSVLAYTTQTKDYFNFGSADHNVVKLGDVPAFSAGNNTNNNNNFLVVKVLLADGKELDITRQGQLIVDNERVVTYGYVTVEPTKSSEDFIGVDAFDSADLPATGDYNKNEALKITLRPRKEGAAQLMVYYHAFLPDGNVQKMAVAPITMQVKGAPTLGAVNFNYSGSPVTMVLSNKPDAEDLWDAKASIQLKDQFGGDYSFDRIDWSGFEIKGANEAAQDLVKNGGIAHTTETNIYGQIDHFISVDGEKFHDKIWAMNAQAVNKNGISGRFTYTITFQDKYSKATKSNTITVDMRGRVTTPTIGTDVGGQSWGGNIARINHWDPWNAKAEKDVTFSVFKKMNDANVDTVAIEPHYTIDGNINAASDGYYFRIFKDGSEVTKKLLETTADAWGNSFYANQFEAGKETPTTLATYDNNKVKIRFSTVKKDSFGNFTVAYDLTGAGNYQFVLYKVEDSRYQNGVKVSTPVSTATRSVSTSCDTMKYSLTKRNDVVLTNPGAINAVDLVPANADNTWAWEILSCFGFADKNGNAYDKWATNDLGVTNAETKHNTAVFAGNKVKYEIKLNSELQKPNSVYVDSVVFYEVVDADAGWNIPGTAINEDNLETIYAAYTVPVNCYVEFQADR